MSITLRFVARNFVGSMLWFSLQFKLLDVDTDNNITTSFIFNCRLMDTMRVMEDEICYRAKDCE